MSNIKADYAKINELNTNLRKNLSTIIDSVEYIKDFVDSLDNADKWQGEAHEVYEKKMKDLCTFFLSACSDIYNEMGTKIESIVGNYGELDKLVQNIAAGMSNVGYY